MSGTQEEHPPRDGGGASPAEEANRIVREWWESYDPRPLGSFPGARKIVAEALERGHTPARVAVALRRCGVGAVPSKQALARELAKNAPPPRSPQPGYDQRPPEDGRSW